MRSEETRMKDVLMIAISILIVWMVWNMIRGLIAMVFGAAFQIAMIVLFGALVYAVYKALTRQKAV
jgi:hypothetical protein